MIELNVVSGPNSGKTGRFGGAVVSLGRDRRNDFVLVDKHVSGRHGEIVRHSHGYSYRDLRSRHGTTVVYSDRLYRLHSDQESKTCPVSHGTSLTIGQTIIELSIPSQVPDDSGIFGLDVDTGEIVCPRIDDATPSLGAAPAAPLAPLSTTLANSILEPSPHLFARANSLAAATVVAPAGAADLLPPPPLGSAYDDLETGTFEAAPAVLGSGHDAGLPELDGATTRLGVPSDLVSRLFTRDEPRLREVMRLCGGLGAAQGSAEVVDQCVRASFEIFPLSHSLYVGLADKKHGLTQMALRFAEGAPPPPAATVISARLIARVLESREPLLYLRSRDYGALAPSFVEGPTHSAMLAPLFGSKNLLGVFALSSNNSGRHFTNRDLELFSLIASFLASTLERVGHDGSVRELCEALARLASSAVEAREPARRGHAERVADHCQTLVRLLQGDANATQLSEERLRALRFAALLHDLGRSGVPAELLDRKQRLDATTLERLSARLEVFKLRSRNFHLECLVQTLDNDQRPPVLGELQKLRRRADSQARKLDKVLDFVRQLSESAQLTAAQRHKLDELEAARLQFAHEEPQPLLLPEELARLRAEVGFLSQREHEIVCTHPARAENWLKKLPWPPELHDVPDLVAKHHERLDGSGFPRGQTAGQLGLGARILAIAEEYDNLVGALGNPEEAQQRLREQAGQGLLDSRLVEVFCSTSPG